MSMLIAHAGSHWTGYITFAPVLLFAGWMAYVMIRDRRAEAKEEQDGASQDKGAE